MKWFTELLHKKNKRLKIMTFLFYLLPIIFLTDKFYRHHYGNYELGWNYIPSCLTNKSFWETTTFFVILFIFCYLLQEIILPLALIFFNKKFTNKRFYSAMYKVNKRFKFPEKDKVFKFISDSTTNKLNMYANFLFFPISISLWLIYINTFWSYFLIIVTFIGVILFIKMINTLIQDEHNPDNREVPN